MGLLINLFLITCLSHTAYILYFTPENDYTGIWCKRDVTGNKMCKLKGNLNYNGNNNYFKVHLPEESVFFGVYSYKDFQTIQLSSVKTHSQFLANLEIGVDSVKYKTIDKKIVIALARFKPDNIMHVIHDDLLPLFVTLEEIYEGDWNSCYQNVNVLFVDDWYEGPYDFLYKKLTKHLLYRKKTKELTEFTDLYIGLDTSSVWFQYGFNGTKRGREKHININRATIKRFTDYFVKKLGLSRAENSRHSLILDRMTSRKIIGVEKIGNILKKESKLDVEIFQLKREIGDMFQNSFLRLLNSIVNTDILIGMHGAEMILALFMKENSEVIEMFPHGVTADEVSFIKPLAEDNIVHFNYLEWSNKDRKASIRHSKYPRHLGGLLHLTQSEQNRIAALEHIENIPCCDHPAYLHLMYQDTIITDEIQENLRNLFLWKENPEVHHVFPKKFSPEIWEFPPKVTEVKCILNNDGIRVIWKASARASGYSISIQFGNKQKAFRTEKNEIILRDQVATASAWVSALDEFKRISSDVYVQCEKEDNSG